MKTACNPLRTTLLYGLICGVLFVPLHSLLSMVMRQPSPFRMIIWVYLAGYSVMMIRWPRKNLTSAFFPLAILFILQFAVRSQDGFMILALVILGWVRSGICFPGSLFKMLAAESLICGGGGFLAACFQPHSLGTWALAIWLFFLIQSVYFPIFAPGFSGGETGTEPDPFEGARKAAEKILSTGP